MVADDLDVYETTKIQPLGSELGHVAATHPCCLSREQQCEQIRLVGFKAVANCQSRAKCLAFVDCWRRGVVRIWAKGTFGYVHGLYFNGLERTTGRDPDRLHALNYGQHAERSVEI